MNLFEKIRIKTSSIREYYVFQLWGFPKVKLDKISKSILKEYLPDNPVIIDCGAHDGVDSVELAKILNAKVFAFEPIPEIFERLKNRTKNNSDIACFQLALGEKNGVQKFFVSEGASDASSSLLEPQDHLVVHPDVLFSSSISVNTKTLESWAIENNISIIDMLWLDMQGFELNMLKAAGEILDSVKVIHTEVSLRETYKEAGLYVELKNYLLKKGFEIKMEAIPQGWDMGNVLFVR